MEEMPMIEATLCYIKKDSRYLMLHRIKKNKDYHQGKWNAIGGKLESGESPLDCVIREVKEETGLFLLNVKFIGHLSFPNFDGLQDWSVFVFKSEDFTGELIDCPEGALSWVEEKDLLNLNLWEGDLEFIPHVLRDEKFMGKFIYKNKELKSFWIQEI